MNQARSGGVLYEVPPYAPKPVNLWIVVPVILGALTVSHLLVAGWGLQDGFQRGRAHEKQLQEATPAKAPANCNEWLRQCASEQVEKFKKFGRKPT